MPSIAIIGAGPAGLTLARLLLTSSVNSQVSFTIFERDASRHGRTEQGGTLDLHPGTGLAAIEKAGLWEPFEKHARYDGEELRICDMNGTVYIHMKGAPQIKGFDARPEIDRETLKDILLDSIPSEMIQWGMHLKTIDESRRVLTFADGTEQGPFDLIVGADGAWSKVRSILTDVNPTYSGLTGFGGRISEKDAGAHWTRVSNMAGKGSHFSYGDRKNFSIQRMGDGSLRIGTFMPKEADWTQDLSTRMEGDKEKIKQAVLDEFVDWEDDYRTCIQLFNNLRPYPLYELPIGNKWTHKQGYTLIGDSAHLMTPFAGEGVNAAMRDAIELTTMIELAIKDSGSLDQAVLDFEMDMFQRAKIFMAKTAQNKITMHQPNAPVGFLASMMAEGAEQSGYDINKGFLYYVPITKTAFTVFSIIRGFGQLRRWTKDYFATSQIRL